MTIKCKGHHSVSNKNNRSPFIPQTILINSCISELCKSLSALEILLTESVNDQLFMANKMVLFLAIVTLICRQEKKERTSNTNSF